MKKWAKGYKERKQKRIEARPVHRALKRGAVERQQEIKKQEIKKEKLSVKRMKYEPK